MPSFELEYPKTPESTVNRYNTRASYALETIHTIVNSAPVIHVSFHVPNSPFPMVLPMIGKMGAFARPSADIGDVLDLYLHGYVSARLMNRARDSNSSSPEEKGLPITVAATHVDGIVLALTPNSHSYNYRSAVLFGHATVVSAPDERLWAMQLITNSIVPNRWNNTRVPPNNAELQSTSILRVKISAGSAKIRSGMPHDERHDVENEEVVGRVWQGVVPVHTTFGEPIPGPLNRVQITPEYITSFVKDHNENNTSQAVEAAQEERIASKKDPDNDRVMR